MKRHALTYRLARRTDHATLARLVSTWPVGWSAGDTRLLGCMVFRYRDLLVRILEIDGDLEAALDGLATDPRVIQAEAALASGLNDPAVLVNPDQVRTLHAQARTPEFAKKITPPALLPSHAGRTRRGALMYPVRSGQGRAVETILSGGASLPTTADQNTALASTSLFRRGDVVFRLVEVAGDLDVGLRHLRAAASRSQSTQALVDRLEPGWDLRNTDGFDRFLSECAMDLIVDHRVRDRGSQHHEHC